MGLIRIRNNKNGGMECNMGIIRIRNNKNGRYGV